MLITHQHDVGSNSIAGPDSTEPGLDATSHGSNTYTKLEGTERGRRERANGSTSNSDTLKPSEIERVHLWSSRSGTREYYRSSRSNQAEKISTVHIYTLDRQHGYNWMATVTASRVPWLSPKSLVSRAQAVHHASTSYKQTTEDRWI